MNSALCDELIETYNTNILDIADADLQKAFYEECAKIPTAEGL